MKRNVVIPAALTTVIMLALVVPQCCVFKEKTVSGRVVDQSTSQPIAGATVMIHWQGYTSGGVDTRSIVLGAALVQTDKNGEFKTKVLSSEGARCFVFSTYAATYVYAPNYTWPGERRNDTEFLIPFKGTREEKLEQIYKTNGFIGGDLSGDSPEYRFARSLFLQAKQLVSEMENVTERQKSIVSSLRYRAASHFIDPTYRLNGNERDVLIEEHMRSVLR